MTLTTENLDEILKKLELMHLIIKKFIKLIVMGESGEQAKLNWQLNDLLI